jgi:hypothetical protein
VLRVELPREREPVTAHEPAVPETPAV